MHWQAEPASVGSLVSPANKYMQIIEDFQKSWDHISEFMLLVFMQH